jgi:hypothetical protein
VLIVVDDSIDARLLASIAGLEDIAHICGHVSIVRRMSARFKFAEFFRADIMPRKSTH